MASVGCFGRRAITLLSGKIHLLPYLRNFPRLLTVTSNIRSDPTAKRPNRVCDPYGQNGKPLSQVQVQSLRATLHDDWRVVIRQDQPNIAGSVESLTSPPTTDASPLAAPISLTREFWHSDFLAGSRFLQSVAAVAEMNAHFPSLHLERRIVQKQWWTVSTVTCHTFVLGGLATHDFHLAMLIDVEVDRPEVQKHCVVPAMTK